MALTFDIVQLFGMLLEPSYIFWIPWHTQVEEKLEAGQGKSTFRRIFSRFCTPIFLEVHSALIVINFGASWQKCICCHLISDGYWIIKHSLFTNKWLINTWSNLCLFKWIHPMCMNDLKMQSFVLTFLAEWGDRSQIATIAVRPTPFSAIFQHFSSCSIPQHFFSCSQTVNLLHFLPMQLATHKNAVGVAVGATLGHTICTSFAVVGGSMLASKISQGTVATIGGLLFLGFSLSSYFYPPLWILWWTDDILPRECIFRCSQACWLEIYTQALHMCSSVQPLYCLFEITNLFYVGFRLN